MSPTAIAVLTRKSVEEILALGGSGYWVLDPRNAKKREYLVCARNAKSPNLGADEPHRSGFLIAPIANIIEAKSGAKQPRWVIGFTEYALISYPELWGNWRNPVRYTTVEELGIDPTTLDFVPLAPKPDPSSAPPKLTLEEAKRGLAATFGVSPEAIEITIRG